MATHEEKRIEQLEWDARNRVEELVEQVRIMAQAMGHGVPLVQSTAESVEDAVQVLLGHIGAHVMVEASGKTGIAVSLCLEKRDARGNGMYAGQGFGPFAFHAALFDCLRQAVPGVLESLGVDEPPF